MKVAIIGVGKWGQVLLKELKAQVEVKYECDSKTDLRKVFSDPEIEAVVIATPTETHFDIASRALDAHKHAFLEKPGTTKRSDLEKLVNKAREKNLKFAIGYEFPHHPAIQKIKELIKGKEIKFIRLEHQKWGTFKDSVVRNSLCHDVSILKYLGIKTDTPTINKIGIVTEADILATRFGSNVMSIINRVSPLKLRTILVKLENNSYLFSNDELFEIVGEELKKIDLPLTTPVTAEITDFLSAIRDNREPTINGKFALEVYKVIEKA